MIMFLKKNNNGKKGITLGKLAIGGVIVIIFLSLAGGKDSSNTSTNASERTTNSTPNNTVTETTPTTSADSSNSETPAVYVSQSSNNSGDAPIVRTNHKYYLGETMQTAGGLVIEYHEQNIVVDPHYNLEPQTLYETIFLLENTGTNSITIGSGDFNLYIDDMVSDTTIPSSSLDSNSYLGYTAIAPGRKAICGVYIDPNTVSGASKIELQLNDIVFVIKDVENGIDTLNSDVDMSWDGASEIEYSSQEIYGYYDGENGTIVIDYSSGDDCVCINLYGTDAYFYAVSQNDSGTYYEFTDWNNITFHLSYNGSNCVEIQDCALADLNGSFYR